MSSLDIAHITGKNHADVLRDIRETLGQAGIGLSRFAASYRNAQNKEQPCYILPRRECDLVISGYSVPYRLAIIDRWHELETKQSFKIPQTMSEALRLAADLSEKVTEQATALAIAAPKVEFYDTVTESSDVCQLAVAAQVAKLPFGRNTLFQKLRELGVLITGGERHNMPKQAYVIHTTYATQKGIAWIIRQFTPQQGLLS